MTLPVAVIGAGPYGLSTAAHLKARAVPTRVFGAPMISWREHMPAGMILKSTPVASSIDAPQPGHTLFDYCQDVGERRFESDWDTIPVETFAGYGMWFQQRLVPALEKERVVSVDRRGPGGGFELKLDSGEQFTARAVVVATGLSGLARLPRELAAAVPAGPSATGPISHSSQHRDLSGFAGKDVVVVGAGQSALESAVLLADAGAASVRIVARRRGAVRFGAAPDGQSPLKPDTPFGRAWSLYAFSYHADGFRRLPAPTREYLVRRVLGPLGAWWLRERFIGRVRVTEGKRIVRARVESGRPVLTLTGDGDGAESVPGLFFTGLPAAASYGPVMRFVCGTEYASPRLARAVAAM